MFVIRLLITALLFFSATANAKLEVVPAASLKEFLATGKNYLDRSNAGWRMGGKGAVCDAMMSVGLGCTYNDRMALVDFLFAHGKNLFPCEGGTNPYTKDSCSKDRAAGFRVDGNNYIGQPIQNKMLTDAIQRNKLLFQGGNLTAENAKKWKL